MVSSLAPSQLFYFKHLYVVVARLFNVVLTHRAPVRDHGRLGKSSYSGPMLMWQIPIGCLNGPINMNNQL